nr:lysophospholipid acyltransferase family protein [uncultured Pedobacter sp.]
MINKGLSKVIVFFLYALSLLPLPVLYLFSDVLFYLLYYVIGYRKGVVAENLRNSFPDKSQKELKAIEKKYFSYLADLIVETIKMVSASPAFLRSRYIFSNLEVIEKYENQNQSYLFAVGHYGNWEWSAVVIPLVTKAKALVIYKPLSNEFFNDFFTKTREKGGTKMIRMKSAMREIIKHKNELTVTVFAADQTPAKVEIKEYTEFLHQQTPIFMGIEKIAKSTDYPVIFCDITRPSRGHYNCDFKLVCDKPSETAEMEITKKHVQILEDRINAEPAYWLWSHKRWKYKPD